MARLVAQEPEIHLGQSVALQGEALAGRDPRLGVLAGLGDKALQLSPRVVV
ncbi:hypothetical protein DSECCO2_362100 [anaerobic digester metagenome]